MTRDPDRNIKPQTDGERFDEPLDRLVSGAKPAVPGFEGDLADFRAGVKQRVAVVRRRRRRRLAARGALAAAVLLVGLVGLDFQDLGSDGFDVEKIDTKGSYEAYQEKFRDSRFIVQDDWTEAEAEEYHRLIRSHYGKPIGMEGYQVDDAPPHLFIFQGHRAFHRSAHHQRVHGPGRRKGNGEGGRPVHVEGDHAHQGPGQIRRNSRQKGSPSDDPARYPVRLPQLGTRNQRAPGDDPGGHTRRR